MLVDARERFAERIAEWMLDSKLTQEELIERLDQFPPHVIPMIARQSAKLMAKRQDETPTVS